MRSRGDRDQQTPLDWAVEALMAAMLLFLPLAYGTTDPWSQEIFFGVVAATGLLTLVRPVIYRGPGVSWTWAYVPILLFIAMAVAQRVPLPRGVLGAVSPRTLAMKDELLADLGTAADLPLTFYTLATDRQLRLILCVATVFAVVVQAYRTPERRRRLLVSVATAGIAVGLLAAYQDLTRAETIYGVVPVGHKNAGPFQNYSHFSQFMNLSIGAALAWLLASLADWSNGWRDAAAAREQAQMVENAFVWPAAAMVVVGPLLVFASMSRMGMISMLVAGAVTAGLLGWRGRPPSGRRRRSHRRGGSFFGVASFGIAVLALLSAVGFDWVFDRLATLQTQHETAIGTRQNLIRDLVPLWKQFPVFGTGLGTHEFVFPQFSRQALTGIFTHAENEYAQLMEETGAVGVALMASFLAVVATAFARVIRSPQRPEQYAAFGLGFGLIAILIHSASDFGQHFPADATLTAICSALLIRLGIDTALSHEATPALGGSVPSTSKIAWAENHEGRHAEGRPVRRTPLVVALFAFATTFAWVVKTGDIDRRAAARYADALDAATEITAGQATEVDSRRVITSAAAARDTVPADVVYAYWAAVTQWQAMERAAVDPQSGLVTFQTDRLDAVRQVVASLDAARRLCPTFGPPLGLAGQLRARLLGDPAGDEQILTAYRLTPHDRELCRLAGLLAVKEKRWDDATTILDHYVRLGGPMWQVVDAFLLSNRPDLAQAATARDWRNLRRLADGLTAGWPNEKARAAECRVAGDRLLVAESDAPDASTELWVERARLEEKNGRAAEAALWYQKAVDVDYNRPDWHLARAKCLVSAGRTDEAVRSLRICLRQRPKWTEAEDMLAELLRGPTARAAHS